MSEDNYRQLKPLLSVVIVIVTLFGLMFLHMEERRIGYSILKLNREQKRLAEEKREGEIALAKVTRPQHVEKIASSKFTLKKIQASQIIHLQGPALTPEDTANKPKKMSIVLTHPMASAQAETVSANSNLSATSKTNVKKQ